MSAKSVCGVIVIGNKRKWMESFSTLIETRAYSKHMDTIGGIQCNIYRIELGCFDFIFPTSLNIYNDFNLIYFLLCLEEQCPYPIKCMLLTFNYISDYYIHILAQVKRHSTYNITLVMMPPDKTTEKLMLLQKTMTIQSCCINFQLPITMTTIKYILRHSRVGETEMIEWIRDDEVAKDKNQVRESNKIESHNILKNKYV